MEKYHKITSAIISLLFLILVQEFSVPRPIFRFLVPVFLVFLAAVTLYNKWYLQKMEKYNAWVLLRSALFFISMFGLFLIIPGSFLRGSFLLISLIVAWAFEVFVANFAENIGLNETLIITFGLFMSISAFALLYAPGFQTLYLAAIFLGTFLTARSFYEFIPQIGSDKLVASLVIALFCTQMFWALTFLPFHYSASALMLLNIFYFCLILNFYKAYNIFDRRKLQFHLALLLVCGGFIFLLTPWKIIN